MDSTRLKGNLSFTGPAPAALLLGVIFVWTFTSAFTKQQNSSNSAGAQSSSTAAPPQAPAPAIPRGKKLMLKDGTFQLVREYHVEGDRVRFYSIDQRDWDEIPESLVDWDATRKMEMGDAKRSLDLIAEARKTDSARNAECGRQGHGRAPYKLIVHGNLHSNVSCSRP